VVAAIRNTDALYFDVLSSARIAVKQVKNRYLVVVYAESADGRKRVITVYHASSVDRLISRKLQRKVWRSEA
jgi:hypothetical protein